MKNKTRNPSIKLRVSKKQESAFSGNSQKIYDFWTSLGLFSADPKSKNPKYSLLIPPPNLTGELHLGHAMQHAILDAVARFKRLQGYDVLLLPGVDHAGIQFEATFDKELSKRNLSKRKLGREKWLEEAWKFKEEIYNKVSKTWRFLGLSADWDREVFTLDDGPRRAVFEEFKTYYDAGLIYKGPYIVQWCPKDNTAIEDVEMEYEERRDKLYFIKYLLGHGTRDTGHGTEKYIVIATTRPETMFADVAVAVNPSDKRYKDLVGKTAIVPFVNREVPIIADNVIDKKFGSGALKVDPAHSLDDWEIGKKHNLEVISVIGKDGRLNENAKGFEGHRAYEAREEIRKSLEEQGLVEKVEELVHKVPVCERCKSTTELLISDEWFVKVETLAKGAISVINKDKIKFLPKNYKKILVEWLGDIHDWCISRSLWWGHRIPVWYPSTRSARSGRDATMKVSLDSPGKGWIQDEQVLDTWFSSGLWPLSTLGWPSFAKASDGKTHLQSVIANEVKQSKDKIASSTKSPRNDEGGELMERYFPWDFEISAPEIKFLWIARMIMISQYFTDKIPFKTMFFHGMLRDLEGRKFSKSLGNGIDPNYLIEQWGVDATRMALYTYSIPGRDGRVSKAILDERGKNFRNFATKLRNIARFILELKPDSNVILSESEESRDPSSPTQDDNKDSPDQQILDELEKTTKAVTKHLENLELHLAVDALYEFVWHSFADKYIESTKERRVDAQPTLENVLKQVLILLHPFMPFVTEEIYQKFKTKRKSIMLEDWPMATD